MTFSLKRAATAGISCLALLAVAGPASASTIKGTVVHHNAHAGSFVVASPSGRLAAVHTRRSPAVGRVVSVSAQRLRNGTFAARSVRAHGRRSHARIRGTVSFVDRRHHAFVISARGASVRVRRVAAHRAVAAGDSLPAVGTVVEVEAALDDQGDLETDDVQEVGEDTDGIELEGVVLSVDAANRTVRVSADDDEESGQSMLVHVPGTFDITAFRPGQSVELKVTATAGGFVLQTSSLDGDAQEADDQGHPGEQRDSGDHGDSDD